MSIKRSVSVGGNFVREPGEYVVRVTENKSSLTKEHKKPMLTIVFQTPDEKLINGYFVKDVKFHMKALEELKLACGLKVTDHQDKLIGKECGILVEAQEPNEQGKIFMQITGYGTAKDVEGVVSSGESDFAPDASEDSIPF